MEGKPITLKTVIKTLHRADMCRMVVQLVALTKGLKLSKSEIIILAHFLSEGYNQFTKEQIVQNKILKNQSTLANMISKFRKYGLIKSRGFDEVLCDELNFQLGDIALFKILLDNR